jgi:hypothetical protein
MDSYIHRFEQYARVQGWTKDTWAVYLAALLKGKALDVYARLPPKEAQEYATLKGALLKRFNKTEEGYKTQIYGSRPEWSESPQQFLTMIGEIKVSHLRTENNTPSPHRIIIIMTRLKCRFMPKALQGHCTIH